MKYSCVILFLMLLTTVRAEQPFPLVVDEGKAKILKVYSATLGSIEYRAYAINWNGQEVVALVNTNLIKTKHAVGDELSFVVVLTTSAEAGSVLLFAEGTAQPLPGV